MDLKGIDHIIFDLGGVILNIDYNRTVRAFESLGAKQFEASYSKAKQSDLFDLFETGQIDADKFRAGLRDFLPAGTTDEQIDWAWNDILLDLPKERVSLIENLGKNYSIYLLSNTNEIHFAEYTKRLIDVYGYDPLKGLFIKRYLSHEIGLRKPSSACFQYVLKDAQMNPARTLFIDDSIQHVEGARALGIRAFHLEGELLDLF